ncbi:hypothetical protein TVAG_156070 [Trichomonas vaginalis G3]|uniref:KATNIP domain-containing protein n=1 Tax=Trichomonas vaginalis (strain ATCC PRA-98 / G3) TaxID=412133 RepID=A2FPD0_TRIV3|nr:hypothetical protein TVAGG3_0497940 [Trichomonas vaginalis G3]EAX93243.1 hypothetical protein TVAG_156070 [Trichomonas vaginalis G3]KAI5516859.1 hypothetical protein TVAGG3_0497940 [Trichomonas vaginalis G3]|eukprot:XP_001306173.1 hypothetical protein [Trichomonas vaginalis G3]
MFRTQIVRKTSLSQHVGNILSQDGLPPLRKNSFSHTNQLKINIKKALNPLIASSPTNNSQSSFSSDPPNKNDMITVIKIKIFSNWGNPTTISCAELSFVNDLGSKLPISTAMFNGQKQEEKLKALWDHGSIEADSNTWKEEWPPEAPSAFHVLLFSVKSQDRVTGIRVWPNLQDTSTNIREISVSMNHNKVFKGELPKDFGMVIPINDENIIHRRLDQEEMSNIKFRPQRITLLAKNTYGNTDVCGIHQILFVNYNGELINAVNKYTIQLENMKNLTDNLLLLRPISSQKNYDAEKYTPWTGEELTRMPMISFVSKKRIPIGAIIIIGPLLHEGSPNIHLKQFSIYFDGKLQRSGRVKQRFLDEKFEFLCATYLFFNDDPEFQKNVRENIIPRRELPTNVLNSL